MDNTSGVGVLDKAAIVLSALEAGPSGAWVDRVDVAWGPATTAATPAPTTSTATSTSTSITLPLPTTTTTTAG